MKNKLKINALITVIAVIICVILLNVTVSILSSKLPLEIDFTKEKVYDFSEQTKSVMSGLDNVVDVYALIPDDVTDDYLDYVKEYLEKYEKMSDKFNVSYIDPYTEPAFLSKYSAKGDSIELGSLIVTCGDKFRVLPYKSLFEKNTYGSGIAIDMETKLTSAVSYVSGSGNAVNIYFTVGHDETSCSNFMGYLAGEGYVCEELNLSKASIPEDASVIVVAGPAKDFTLEEIDMMDAFSEKGGQLIVMAPLPGVTVPENLGAYLLDWGIEFGNDRINENDSARMINTVNGVALAPQMQQNAVTEKLIARKLEYVSPEASSVITYVNNIYGAVHSDLLTTSEQSESISYLDSSIADGPFSVATLAVRMTAEGKNSHLFALGSLVSAEAPVIIGNGAYANSDFLLNVVASITNSSTSLDIRAKQISPGLLNMTESQVKTTQILLLYIIPLLIFAAGVVVWVRRRYL